VGDTLAAINERVTLARDAATAGAEAVRTNAAAQVPAGGGTTRLPAQPPEKIRGVSRIAYALSNPGPGNTE